MLQDTEEIGGPRMKLLAAILGVLTGGCISALTTMPLISLHNLMLLVVAIMVFVSGAILQK